jgi:WD40 repeat protein
VSDDGKQFVTRHDIVTDESGIKDHLVLVHDAISGESVRIYSSDGFDRAQSLDGRYVASWGGGSINFFDCHKDTSIARIPAEHFRRPSYNDGIEIPGRYPALSQNGKVLAGLIGQHSPSDILAFVHRGSKKVVRMDTNNKNIENYRHPIGVWLSPSGKLAVVQYEQADYKRRAVDHAACLVDTRTGKILSKLFGFESGEMLVGMDFSINEESILLRKSAESGNTKKIETIPFNVTTRMVWPLYSKIIGLTDADSHSTISPDGKTLLMFGWNPSKDKVTLEAWDLENGIPLKRIAHDDVIVAAQFSSNGKFFIVQGEKSVSIYDSQTLSLVYE